MCSTLPSENKKIFLRIIKVAGMSSDHPLKDSDQIDEFLGGGNQGGGGGGFGGGGGGNNFNNQGSGNTVGGGRGRF